MPRFEKKALGLRSGEPADAVGGLLGSTTGRKQGDVCQGRVGRAGFPPVSDTAETDPSGGGARPGRVDIVIGEFPTDELYSLNQDALPGGEELSTPSSRSRRSP